MWKFALSHVAGHLDLCALTAFTQRKEDLERQRGLPGLQGTTVLAPEMLLGNKNEWMYPKCPMNHNCSLHCSMCVYFPVVGKTASICNFWVHLSTRVFLRLLSGAISVLVTGHELFFLYTLDCSWEPQYVKYSWNFLSSEHFCKSAFLVLSHKPILVVHCCHVFQFVCPLWMVSYISSVLVWEMVIQEAAYTGNEHFALQLMHCIQGGHDVGCAAGTDRINSFLTIYSNEI